MFQVAGAQQGAAGGTRRQVDTGGANILLPVQGALMRVLTSSAPIAGGPVTVAIGANNGSYEFRWRFTTLAAFDMVWPVNVLMADPSFESGAPNTYPIPGAGNFEAHGVYDGTNWYVSIVGIYI